MKECEDEESRREGASWWPVAPSFAEPWSGTHCNSMRGGRNDEWVNWICGEEEKREETRELRRRCMVAKRCKRGRWWEKDIYSYRVMVQTANDEFRLICTRGGFWGWGFHVCHGTSSKMQNNLYHRLNNRYITAQSIIWNYLLELSWSLDQIIVFICSIFFTNFEYTYIIYA